MKKLSFLIIWISCFSTNLFAYTLYAFQYSYPGFLMASHRTSSGWDSPEYITPYGAENCFGINICSSNSYDLSNYSILSWLSNPNQNSGLNFQLLEKNREESYLSSINFPRMLENTNCAFTVDPVCHTGLFVFEKTEEENGKSISSLYYSYIDLSSPSPQWAEPKIIIKESDTFQFSSEFSLSAAKGSAVLVFTGTDYHSDLGPGIYIQKLDISNSIWSERHLVAKGELFQPQVVYDGNDILITFEEDSLKNTKAKIAIQTRNGFITLPEILSETPFYKGSIPASPPRIALKNGTALLAWVVTDPLSSNKRIQSGMIDLYATQPSLQVLNGSAGPFLSAADLDSNYVELSCDNDGNAIAVWLGVDKNKSQLVEAATFQKAHMFWSPTVDLTEKGKPGPSFYQDLAYPTVRTNSRGDTVVAWSWFNGLRNVIQVVQGNIQSDISSWNINSKEIVSNSQYQSYCPQIALDEKGAISLSWISRDIYPPTNLCVTEDKIDNILWSISSKSLKWDPSVSKSAVGYKIYRDNKVVGKVSGKTYKYSDSYISKIDKIQYAVTAVDRLGNESVPQSISFEETK